MLSAAVLTLYWYVTLLVPFVSDTGAGLLAVFPYVQFAIVTLPEPFAFAILIVIVASFVTFELLSDAFTTYVYVPAVAFAAIVIVVPDIEIKFVAVPAEFFSDTSAYVYVPVPLLAPVIVAVCELVLNVLFIVWLLNINGLALQFAIYVLSPVEPLFIAEYVPKSITAISAKFHAVDPLVLSCSIWT